MEHAHPPDLLACHETLSAALGDATDARSALGAVCEAVRQLVGCDRVQVWRGDLRQMTMGVLIAVGYGPSERARIDSLSVPLSGMPLAPDFLERRYLVLPGVRRAGDSERLLFDAFGIEAAAFVLLERADRILGAMQLSWCTTPTPSFPSPEVAALVRRYAGLAVDIHARTDEAMQMSTTLSETAMLLSHIHEPDALLEAIAGKITEAVGCDWGTVHLLAAEERRYRCVAGAGSPAIIAHLHGVAGPAAVVEAAFADAEDGLIEMPEVDAVPAVLGDLPRGLVSSYVSLPLRRDGALIGLLSLGYGQRTGRFSRRQIALARGLAHHAVAALANARLVRSLRDVNQVQSDFVAAVSHDLRTPLHILIGYNDMLLDGAAGDLQPAQRELIARVRACCGRFLELIEDILEVARLDAGHTRRQTTRVDLHALCRGLAAELDELRRPDVALHWSATAGTVEADGPKLKTILRNLASNALKFTTTGQVAMAAVVGRDGALTLRVADTGPGIDPQDASRIFEMFQQGDAGRRAGGSGLGLGLYLVKRLAEVLGGSATLVSGDPGNTLFEVTVPLPRDPTRQLERVA